MDARIRDPRRVFGWVQAGIAVERYSAFRSSARSYLGQYWLFQLEQRWVALFAARFGISFAIMLLPTTLIGMSFPLAGRIGVRDIGAWAELGRLRRQ